MRPPFAMLGALLLAASAATGGPPTPKVNDPRLDLTLFAADPDVATPVGLACDEKGRLFVLESHTHSPPRDYAGPRSDRIKVFTDANRDGKPDAVTIFAEELADAMNLAFSREGVLHVVTSARVWALHDRDGDGVSEDRTKVLELVTPQPPYEHAALLGITFSHDGWMYVSRGNTGSLRYTLKGSDGSSVSGFGDGGNIFRCRPDGSKVEELATGFWNPFGIHFDRHGRLVCVDNDPDARGPNRLVHVIPGGDYGYKSLYGGGGNHPYQSWNGELPGTLPFVAGLGEAPCGLIDASLTALPRDYADSVLCTVWGEHNITRARLRPRGASVTADVQLLIEGGQDFRPVGIAADPAGVVYIGDWVRRDYPNHGKGRIWRLTANDGADRLQPRKYLDPPAPDAAAAELHALATETSIEPLKRAVASPDPFVRSAAVAAVAKPAFREGVLKATRDANADVRLGALLALRRARHEGGEAVASTLLADLDPRVRQMAMVWAGEATMTSLAPELKKALSAGPASPVLLETYLATVENLTPEFARGYRGGTEPKANSLKRRLDPKVVEDLVRDESNPPLLCGLALTRLERPEEPRNFETLKALLHAKDLPLRLEAMRTLADCRHRDAAAVLLEAAKRAAAPPDLRAEALLALTRQPGEFVDELLLLLDDLEPAVRSEAVRSLRDGLGRKVVREALEKKYDAVRDDVNQAAFAERLEFALNPPASAGADRKFPRPGSLEQWQSALSRGGDPASGRRVFFSAQAGCARCHTIDNRGGRLGPDLSRIGTARTRAQIVHAVVRPSDEYSIDYQAWFIQIRGGDKHLGLQLDLKDRGDIELFTLDAKTTHFKGSDIEAYGAMKQSLMPDGLEAAMSVEDFRDLVAFLEARR